MKQVQYTIRSVPQAVDESLRLKAKKQNRSLNSVTVEALQRATGNLPSPRVYHDLDWLAGTLSVTDERLIQQASKKARTIHPKDWK
jgi:hypothetical protein